MKRCHRCYQIYKLTSLEFWTLYYISGLILPWIVCGICKLNSLWIVHQIYKNLYGAMMQGEKVMERPSYWQDFTSAAVKGSPSSKLWMVVTAPVPLSKAWPPVNMLAWTRYIDVSNQNTPPWLKSGLWKTYMVEERASERMWIISVLWSQGEMCPRWDISLKVCKALL